MRRTLRSVALAGVLAVGGLVGLGTTTARAQGFGGYYPGGYGGYPGIGYGRGCGGGYGGAYGGSPVLRVGGYGGGWGYGGYYGGYGSGYGRGYGGFPYRHHHHYRGCGCRY